MAEGWDPVSNEVADAEQGAVLAAAELLQLAAEDPSRLAHRIGAIYPVEDVARWLTPPDAGALTTEAVRKLAKLRQLVAFVTDDRQLVFPAWQFDRVGGRLVSRDPVVVLWRELPADDFLTDVGSGRVAGDPAR